MRTLALFSFRPTRLIGPAAALLSLVGGAAPAAAPAASAAPAATTATPAMSSNLTWHPFALIHGWQSASQPKLVTGTPAWAFHDGVVYFRGAIAQPNTSGGTAFAHLPPYARPAHSLYIHVYTNEDNSGILYVGKGGTLEAYDGSAFAFTSLAAVSYPTAAIKSHPFTLENNWSSSDPTYQTGDPSYTNSGGVVYLSGSLNGGSSHLAAMLPKADRPAQQMLVSIYTFDGAVGWLQILPTGQVEVFGASSKSFTSLANVSFPVASTTWHVFKLEDGWTSGKAAHHTADPSYAIIGGIVYLNGSMHQANGHVGLWTILPAGVRTAADVLEIESYAANGIAGSIGVTDSLGLVSSNPFSDAQQLTSIAGIAYPQSS